MQARIIEKGSDEQNLAHRHARPIRPVQGTHRGEAGEEKRGNVTYVWWRGLPELIPGFPRPEKHSPSHTQMTTRGRRVPPVCRPVSPSAQLPRLIPALTVPDSNPNRQSQARTRRGESLTKRRCWCHRRRPRTRCCGDPQTAETQTPSLWRLCARPSAWRPACAARQAAGSGQGSRCRPAGSPREWGGAVRHCGTRSARRAAGHAGRWQPRS